VDIAASPVVVDETRLAPRWDRTTRLRLHQPSGSNCRHRQLSTVHTPNDVSRARSPCTET
jgi:hypothetical protein